MTITDRIPPIHPGEVLMEDFIKGFEITQNKFAVATGVPPRRINEIVHGRRGITANTALRLERYFGFSAQFGSTCRRATSWIWRRIVSPSKSRRSLRCGLRNAYCIRRSCLGWSHSRM